MVDLLAKLKSSEDRVHICRANLKLYHILTRAILDERAGTLCACEVAYAPVKAVRMRARNQCPS